MRSVNLNNDNSIISIVPLSLEAGTCSWSHILGIVIQKDVCIYDHYTHPLQHNTTQVQVHIPTHHNNLPEHALIIGTVATHPTAGQEMKSWTARGPDMIHIQWLRISMNASSTDEQLLVNRFPPRVASTNEPASRSKLPSSTRKGSNVQVKPQLEQHHLTTGQ